LLDAQPAPTSFKKIGREKSSGTQAGAGRRGENAQSLYKKCWEREKGETPITGGNETGVFKRRLH